MTPDWLAEAMVGLAVLGVTFIAGCWWGLWLSATRPARMERFATWAHHKQMQLNEIDYEMRGINR